MGMYDTINLEMDCPTCGNTYLEFQSKEGDCLLDRLEPADVESFYTFCDICCTDIHFLRLDEELGRHFPSLIKKSWRFGRHLYKCIVSFTLESDPYLIKTRKPAMIREIEDKTLKEAK